MLLASYNQVDYVHNITKRPKNDKDSIEIKLPNLANVIIAIGLQSVLSTNISRRHLNLSTVRKTDLKICKNKYKINLKNRNYSRNHQ